MGTVQTFEQLEIWQKARELNREIYAVSKHGPFLRDFALRDQIRKASISAMSNIAEGFERNGSGEFLQFLSISKGSTGEVRSQLYVALDENYINQDEFSRLSARAAEIGRMIGGLMNYLRGSNIHGTKFRHRR